MDAGGGNASRQWRAIGGQPRLGGVPGLAMVVVAVAVAVAGGQAGREGARLQRRDDENRGKGEMQMSDGPAEAGHEGDLRDERS